MLPLLRETLIAGWSSPCRQSDSDRPWSAYLCSLKTAGKSWIERTAA
jgi:hypothetical protein